MAQSVLSPYSVLAMSMSISYLGPSANTSSTLSMGISDCAISPSTLSMDIADVDPCATYFIDEYF